MAGNTDLEDREDMARLQAGHDAALNAIMQRHGERLFHYLLRQLSNETDAGDLAQEAFVRVYHHRARFDSAQKFSTWLYAIATNLLRDRLRWHQRHPEVSLDAESDETGPMLDCVPDRAPPASDHLAAEERAREVQAAVHALPE
ncbi:MAG TPA: sigma-70 family RNA polymerase sigma factor, partial [Candidatus Acidoferrum sp.]|nr:sigma-70 family RNA polymerase sigma factor [Candidatus Acidoferrum sp.]